jgi:hypothetical protein
VLKKLRASFDVHYSELKYSVETNLICFHIMYRMDKGKKRRDLTSAEPALYSFLGAIAKENQKRKAPPKVQVWYQNSEATPRLGTSNIVDE